MSDDSIILKARDLSKVYRLGVEEVYALREMSLDVQRGSYVSIMGPSGSGKSTFFNIVGGLDTPTNGEVFLEGYKYAELSSSQMSWVRCHKIGFIFQSFNLIPSMSAEENVAIARIFAGISPAQASKDAAHVLDQVGLGDRLTHLPSELSGGQQQRVAIARAIVNEPEIVLADEPTGNLDLHTGQEIIELLGKMKKELHITVISATHDMKMLSASDIVVWISDGAIKRIANRDEVDIDVGTIDGQQIA